MRLNLLPICSNEIENLQTLEQIGGRENEVQNRMITE